MVVSCFAGSWLGLLVAIDKPTDWGKLEEVKWAVALMLKLIGAKENHLAKTSACQKQL